MRSLFLALLLIAALIAGLGDQPAVYAAATVPAGHAPVAAQAAPGNPAPSPTPRRRDEPPPPSVIERTQPTLRLAGLLGISTVLLILLASVLLHRRHLARSAQPR